MVKPQGIIQVPMHRISSHDASEACPDDPLSPFFLFVLGRELLSV